MIKVKLEDRILGCFVGAAIGDALGMPLEDVPPDKAKEYYPNGITKFERPHEETACNVLKAGQYTDDTQLIISLAESLLFENQFSPDNFAEKLKEWYKHEDNQKRYRGQSTINAIKNLISGINWKESGVQTTGCGGATRAIPIGIFYNQNLNLLKKYSETQCSITHKSQICFDGAICIASIISNVLNKKIISTNVTKKMVNSMEFKNKIDIINMLLKNRAKDNIAIQFLGNSSQTLDVVCLSLFIFQTEPDKFKNAVLRAANAIGEKGGDTDTIAFLVGAFSGAYNGISNIPSEFVEEVENSQYLQELGKRFYKAIKPNS